MIDHRRFFHFMALALLAAAALVFVLECYVAVEVSGDGQSVGPILASSVANALRDAGLLAALAATMVALDRRMAGRWS